MPINISAGIADDFLSTLFLASSAPTIIAPAMNVQMWNNSIVQENVSKLRSVGVKFIDPEEGYLAEGIEGYLRAADLSRDFVEDARNALQSDTEIEARVTSIERKSRRITLSVKALEMEIEGKAIEEYTTKSSTTISLGDKLKEELSKRES